MIPTPAALVTGTQFISSLSGANNSARENIALQALLEGNVPDHMRELVDITLTFADSQKNAHTLVIHVTPDVLMIGTGDDNVRIPLWPLTAQKVADAWGCMLTTSKVSDIIWHAAVNRLAPMPWGPPHDASMQSTDRLVKHNARIINQAQTLGCVMTKLTAGHKKDVVISNLLSKPNCVVIYGWHQSNGAPIQPLYNGHEAQYTDYSHGIRLMLKTCVLDGVEADVTSVLKDQNLCNVLSNENAFRFTRYT